MTRNGYLGALATRLRRQPPPVASVETQGPPPETYRTTHVLSDFVAAVRAKPAPIVLDLGPALGRNITFLGEEIACKVFIEDLLGKRPGGAGGDDDSWQPRLSQPDESVDGVLCWDVLDHLDDTARWALAAELSRVLCPAGVLLLYQRVDPRALPGRLVYEIAGPDRVCLHRTDNAAQGIEQPLKHRDLEAMFEGLRAVKTVLLKSRTREVLLRKADPATAAA
ncbi:MAG: class I SAM-dependent methyltransferase [Acidobacteria bacterium]|nr:class I SAM-dependent methyltransferase [Acidobacteriota bacterium]